MNISDIKVGKTWFAWGERNKTREVVKIDVEKDRILVEEENGERLWCNIKPFPNTWKDVPDDLHDMLGNPLKMGAAFLVAGDDSTTVCGARIADGEIYVIDEYRNIWRERFITKVEPQETVDDVRKYYQGYDWYVLQAIERAIKATRAEYEK